MTVGRITGLLLLIGSLAGCYGTKPPPPLHSPTPPAGLGRTPSSSSSFTIPPDLPGLLAAYRQSLLEQSHLLPRATAENHADAEIESLTSKFNGRENDLKAEIASRLQPLPSGPASRTGKARSEGYPVETVSEKRRGDQ